MGIDIMGVNCDSKLLVGWTISYDQMTNWAKNNEFDYEDMVSTMESWELHEKYKDWTIGFISPQFGCDMLQCYITANIDTNEISFKDLQEWLTPERISLGKELANEMDEYDELQITTLLQLKW
jgi:hypothetical protein